MRHHIPPDLHNFMTTYIQQPHTPGGGPRYISIYPLGVSGPPRLGSPQLPPPQTSNISPSRPIQRHRHVLCAPLSTSEPTSSHPAGTSSTCTQENICTGPHRHIHTYTPGEETNGDDELHDAVRRPRVRHGLDGVDDSGVHLHLSPWGVRKGPHARVAGECGHGA